MIKNLVIRKGVVHGETIVVESGTGLPDGQEVLVGVAVTDSGRGGESEREELAQEMEAQDALDTIQRMRHTGRGLAEP